MCTCEAGARVLDAACVLLDETTWSVLVLESLSCERRDFYDERAPLESTAALSRAGVGAQR